MEIWNKLTPKARSASIAYLGLSLAIIATLVLVLVNSCLFRTNC
jgi:hypothetical protein